MGTHEDQELRLDAVSLSPGIAAGKVIVRMSRLQEPLPEIVPEEEIEGEIEKLKAAIKRVSTKLDEVASGMGGEANSDQSKIFEAHQLLLEDPSVLGEVERRIREEQLSCAYLYHDVMRGHADTLRKVDDHYLRERASDIEDVAGRVLRDLGGMGDPETTPDFAHILVAGELHPSDTAEMEPEQVLAFAVEHGSPTSHVAIIARSLGIPAVAGIGDLHTRLHSGDQIVVDGDRGLVILRPNEQTLENCARRVAERKKAAEEWENARQGEAQTRDGVDIVVSANIEFKRELDAVPPSGAKGIGLYRTEFLFLNQDAPDEDYQAAYYERAFRKVEPEAVIFRSIDLGGDKTEPHPDFVEPNPFLGWRGIRYSLDRKDHFRTQLRAMLRGGAGRELGIMFPLISTVEEIHESKAILAECQAELEKEGVAPPSKFEVGAMIEVPSAALMAEAIAREVDFLSVGTNDLVQYTTAVDRVNERVASRYQPFHPAVLKLIAATVEAGQKHGAWTGVCGEIASDVVALPALIGLGVDELSMATTAIARLKFALRRTDAAACREMIEHGLSRWTTAAEVEDACLSMARQFYPDLVGS